jgi:hypothetical protein
MLATVMEVFLLAMIIYKRFKRGNLIFLASVIMAVIVIDIVQLTFENSPGGKEKDFENIIHGRLGIDQFAKRWSNLVYTTQVYVGGLFGNFIIFALGLLWLFNAKLQEWSNIFIIVFLSVGLIPLFVGNEVIQARTFYNIPFQIPSAIGLAYIKRKFDGCVIVTAICVWLIANSITSVLNFAPFSLV